MSRNIGTHALVAQLVERRSEEPGAASSILAEGIMIPFRLVVGHRFLTPKTGVQISQRKYDCVAKRKGSRLQPDERRFDPYHSLLLNAFVAQLVERMPEEHSVASSILAGGTMIPFRLTGRTTDFDSVSGSSTLSAEVNKSLLQNMY